MGELKDKRVKTATELAHETADAMVSYLESLRQQDWKGQDAEWMRAKKAAAKYRIAAAREKKKQPKQEGML